MIQKSQVTLNDISHHYDELDEIYRELWGTHLHHGLWEKGDENKEEAVVKLSKKVLSEIDSIKGGKILDIGCGYGATARLAVHSGAAQVAAITLSSKQFEYARRKSKGLPIDYIFGDWMENRFEDETFDGAYSIECFTHMNDKKKFFTEVKRTLKPGKILVLSDWLSGSDLSFFDKKFILGPICEEGRIPSLLTMKEIESMAKDVGFTVLKVEDLSSKVWKTWPISSASLIKFILSPKGLLYLTNSKNREKLFALSVFRIFLGYLKGSFKYGFFVFKN